MKRVLITGANGFIGNALCEKLILSGYDVLGLVRSSDKMKSLPKGVPTVNVGSIGQYTDWSRALTGVNVVIHLAARTHILKENTPNPINEYREVNLYGTGQLARMAVNEGVKRLIFMSSVGVNGEQNEGTPFSESDQPNPSRPYSVSKWEAEKVLKRIAYETGLEIVIIRPPLVHGPGVKGNMLQLLNLVKWSVPLPLAKVNNKRSFIGVTNLVDVLIKCIDNTNVSGETMLVSDGEDISTPDLIRRLANMMNKPNALIPFPESLLRIIYSNIGKNNPLKQICSSLTIDTSKMCSLLKWKPPLTLNQGLEAMVSWYLGHRCQIYD